MAGECEKILELLGDGGSITLWGERLDGCWRFRVESSESAMLDMLDEEDRVGLQASSQGVWKTSWLEVMAPYEYWPRMHLDYVHPEFCGEVFTAFREHYEGLLMKATRNA